MIDNGQVLEAHKRLMELETTRDDLLLQLHRTTSERIDSKHPVNHYFINMMEISDKLANHLWWFILQRALNVVQSDPTQLVTALRVIEREEKSDKKALDREKQTGFLPPGRPKRWRKKCLDTLEKATVERFESQPQTDDTIWLAVYLERVKRIIVDDLTTVKRLFVPCFPPSYNILICTSICTTDAFKIW
ncbi:exocyst complex component 3-like [Oscarella lobularis]|uniref:exocyst complex component 3-like n=1 Tax=Oscarella lobularis TaxID=121494 RepID=UPI00331432CA